MKLYYFADGCSLATHIALREAGIVPDLFKVDVATREIENGGGRFAAVNPKGYVPTLIFDDGSMLTENVALLDWAAQQASASSPRNDMERTRLIEALSFISTEIHKQYMALFFLPGDDAKPMLAERIVGRFRYLADRLEGDYLLGDRFTTADAFLYVMLRWAKMSNLEVPAVFKAYVARIESRDSVRAALDAEGIKPTARKAA